ncbi:hypothetical protein G3567_12950 [Psychroflexus sp. YR1-1]|uniref:Uncharacterized protein n=1 Tax=Psychroflexus aurantiacus TaxID=2709310 RepID=A0A6B3R760_9FLAO|nr:hypothetical protein [Psychroflexus aurantiacus]NEV95045.1 hypothetical protein [Psychroflexus aurantiacus]
MNIKKESKSTLLVVIIIIISMVIIFFFSMGIDYLNYYKDYNWIFYFLGYLALLFLISWLNKKYPSKILQLINICMSFPIAFVLFLYQFALPALGLIFHVIYFAMISISIPLIIIKLNEYFGYYTLSKQTIIFITLTSATCISVTFYKQILNFIYHLGPLRIKSSRKIRKFRLEELTEYVINKENIRFIIYSSFFIYIMVYSFHFFQNSSIFDVQEQDKAVYQSFLCFLAFDRLLLNSKRFLIIPSELLRKLINSIRQNEDK